MQLALFTDGARLWPVHRNFEGFVAEMGRAMGRSSASSAGATFSSRMDSRLLELHRELYQALLRPSSYYRHEQRSFSELFWPDLRFTALDELFQALSFFFLHRTLDDLPVASGLSLLRSVFFNHESAEPELWLASSLNRLSAERAVWPALGLSFTAPPQARVAELAFCLSQGRWRPPHSAGWIVGQITRQYDGRLLVNCQCGCNPVLQGQVLTETQRQVLLSEVQTSVGRCFGWQGAQAA